MELRIEPAESYKSEPFVININYQETIENLIYTISLTITNVPVTEMRVFHNRKRLQNMDQKISQCGINFGDTIELRRGSSNCCLIL